MKSEVIALTSFVTDGRTDGRTPSISMSPPGGGQLIIIIGNLFLINTQRVLRRMGAVTENPGRVDRSLLPG